MPRLFFAGDICDIQCLPVSYVSECKAGNKGEKKGLERVCKPSLGSKSKPTPTKPSVKFKCSIWSEITKKFDKKCLDVSSL